MEEITANQEAVIIAKHDGIIINNTEILGKIMDIRRLESLIKNLNSLAGYSNVFDVICSIIYTKLERACKRSKPEYYVLIDIRDEGGKNVVYYYIEERKKERKIN